MPEQELPPGVCPECYRTDGEHALDCMQQEQKEDHDSVLKEIDSVLKEITDKIHSTEAQKGVDDVFIQYCAEEVARKQGIVGDELDSGQKDSFIAAVTKEVMIKLGEYSQKFFRLGIELSDVRDKLILGAWDTIKPLREEVEDKEWKTEEREKVVMFDELVGQIKSLKEVTQQIEKSVVSTHPQDFEEEYRKSQETIDLLKEKVDRYLKTLSLND